MIEMNSSADISPSPSPSNSSIIALNSSSGTDSPNSRATRRRLRREIFPLSSSSNSLNACRMAWVSEMLYTRWLQNWLTARLIDWWTARMIDCKIDWLQDWLTERLTDRKIDWQRLRGWQIDWKTDWYWMTERFESLEDWFIDWAKTERAAANL